MSELFENFTHAWPVISVHQMIHSQKGSQRLASPLSAGKGDLLGLIKYLAYYLALWLTCVLNIPNSALVSAPVNFCVQIFNLNTWAPSWFSGFIFSLSSFIYCIFRAGLIFLSLKHIIEGKGGVSIPEFALSSSSNKCQLIPTLFPPSPQILCFCTCEFKEV